MQIPRTRTLGDYLVPLWRYKWRAMLVLTATIAGAGAWVVYGPRVYESEAKLFVRVGRENAAIDPILRPGETISLRASREEEINSIVEHLRSRAILEKAFAKIRPNAEFPTPQDRERALRTLNESIEISSPRASTVITIWSEQGAPEQAQAVVAAILEVFLDEHMRIHRSTRSYDFFVQQSEMLKKKLDAAQASLRNAKNQAGIGSIDGRRAALETQVSTIETQEKTTTASLAASSAKIIAMQSAVAELPEQLLQQLVGGTPNDGLAEMQSQLFELRVFEKEMLADLKEKHPKLGALRKQVSQVQEALASQDAERSQLMTALLSNEIANEASLKAHSKKLRDQLESLFAELKELNDVEVEIVQLHRNITQFESEYLAYSENMELSRMDQQLRTDRISNMSILQPATFVADHVSPRPAKTLLLGGVVGCLFAWLLVLISDRLDPRIRSERSLSRDYDLPELASIPPLPRSELEPSLATSTAGSTGEEP